MRACLGSLNPLDCPGPNAELESCSAFACPWWGQWQGWGDCSEQCGGGTRERSRDCLYWDNEVRPDEECAGSETGEELCNQTSCEREIIYWNNQLSMGNWVRVTEDLPTGEDILGQCSSYCLSLANCLGFAVSTFRFNENMWQDECYVNDSPYTSGPNCWGSLCDSDSNHQSIVFGVFKDYYEENPEFLPTDDPDGEAEVNVNDVDGLCSTMQVGEGLGSAFGLTTFKESNGITYETDDDRNVLREDGTADCGERCFMKAGCKAFYTNINDDTCTMIFNPPTGSTAPGQVIGAGNGGMLTDLCANVAFEDQVSLWSRFNCLFFAPDDPDIVDRVLEYNSFGPEALNTWTYEVLNENPYVVQARHIYITWPDMEGTDERYRAIFFNIETHIRVGKYNWVIDSENMTGRKRRDSAGGLTEAEDAKNHRQSAKAAKKQRNEDTTYPLEAVLAAAQAADKAATDALLGGLVLPEGVSVVATTPSEIVEFVQRTNDGSIAADCSTGTDCVCGRGFIDNGDGCVEMTEEQAATTEAPTTQVPTTSYSNVIEYLPSLVDKMNDVFENNRPGAGRSHLSRKWNNLSQKFIGRYNKLAEKGCNFSTGLENTVDFDTINTCRVSYIGEHFKILASN